jgi:hypothetical protein
MKTIAELNADNSYKKFDGLVIKNVVLSDKVDGGMTLVLNKDIEQYQLDVEKGTYELKTTRNLFTTRIQMAAVLKQANEAIVANIVSKKSEEHIIACLVGARIGGFSRTLTAGENFVNPFSANEDSGVATEHDRVQYFVTEIELQDKAVIIGNLQLAAAL